jgi:hypothetical protein
MLLSLAFCHILPEANEMYATFQAGLQIEEALSLEVDSDQHQNESSSDDVDNEEDSDHDMETEESSHDEHDEHAGHNDADSHGFPLPSVLFFCGFMLMIFLD